MEMHQQYEEIAQTINELDLVEPADYAVILLNDNTTPMEFVVHVLERIFNKSHDDAVDVMLRVHRDGEGLAGVYCFELAEQKGIDVTVLARGEGFPLKVRLDPK